MLVTVLLSSVFFGILLGAWYVTTSAVSTGTRCPECGKPTQLVVGPRPFRTFKRWVQIRWCPPCGWQGVRRRGVRTYARRFPGPPMGDEVASADSEGPELPPLLWGGTGMEGTADETGGDGPDEPGPAEV